MSYEMRCILVFSSVMFVECFSKYCVLNNAEKYAFCRRLDTNRTLDFIPPITNFILGIYLSGQPLTQLPYNAFQNVSSQRNISRIDLQACRINQIHAVAFLDLKNLTELELTFNDIQHLDIKTFQYTKQIQYMYMGYNRIKVLPKGLFENLILLRAVSLSFNQISYIETDAFKNTPSLHYITLNNNKLHYLDVSFKDNFASVTYLNLVGNPWNCDYKNLELYDLFKRIETKYHQQIPICEYPREFHGKRWSTLTREDFINELPNSNKESVTMSQWMFAFVALGSIIGLITGVVFVSKYIFRKFSRKRHMQLPAILRRNRILSWRARTENSSRTMRRNPRNQESESQNDESSTEEHAIVIHHL